MNRHYYSKQFLRILRNKIEINRLIVFDLNIQVQPPVDKYLRFCCPLCLNFNTATDLKTNLARCFHCQKSFNPIDIVIFHKECSFIEAVRFLTPLLSPVARTLIESEM